MELSLRHASAILAPSVIRAAQRQKGEGKNDMWLIHFHIVTLPIGLIVAWILNGIRTDWTVLDLSPDNVIAFPKENDQDDDIDNKRAA